jgi:hypothetical protein
VTLHAAAAIDAGASGGDADLGPHHPAGAATILQYRKWIL